jgi:hypothetical protein
MEQEKEPFPARRLSGRGGNGSRNGYVGRHVETPAGTGNRPTRPF